MIRYSSILIIGIFLQLAYLAPAETIGLAISGSPTKTIRIPTTASPALHSTAAKLAGYLEQISGGTFLVQTFDPVIGPEPGIVLGQSSDLNLTSEVPDPSSDMKIRERYIISAANAGQYVILAGATDLALQNAIYDWLEELNCRWFFGSPNWTIIPSSPTLSWTTPSLLRTRNVTMGGKTLAMNIYIDELPDFKMRSIWAQYMGSSGVNGDWRQQHLDWLAWCEQNRVVSSYTINAGHAYDSIISWAKTKGVWSDSYYALINGMRPTTAQLSLGNPGVQQILRDYTQEKLAGTAESVSLEPRDGGAWGTDPLDEAIQPLSSGSVTDRVITANNFAASAVPPGKYIGMYAYNYHSAPPSMMVSDRVYVMIATAFLKQGYTVDGLLAGWGAKAQNLGVREYFSVWDWDHNLPGKAGVANLARQRSRIPYYYFSDADVISAESTDAWGPLGLGFYISAKLLWNTDADVDALKIDFLNRCFGPAAGTMRSFYDRIDPSNNYPLSRDLIGRLYGYIQTARGQTNDSGIVARLDDLTLYLRYVELVAEHGLSSEAVLRYVWKIKNTNMVSSLTCWRKFAGAWPNGHNWQVKPPNHPWKEATTYSHAEIVQMNLDGIANNPSLPVEPRIYNGEMIPSGAAAILRGEFSRTRGPTRLVIRGDSGGVLPTLSIANGFSYTNRGDATWSLYTEDGETLLESGTIPPTQTAYPVTFSASGIGENFLFVYNDTLATSKITWPAGSKVTIFAGNDSPLWQSGRAGRLYFYVPKGATYVEAYASTISNCTFYSAAGVQKKAFTSQATNVDIVIPVNAGEDSQIWYITQMSAVGFEFRNIPAFFALSPDELLIPKDALVDLVPSGQSAQTRGSTGGMRFINDYYLHTRSDGSLPPLTIANGYTYTNRGNLTWTLYGDDGTTELETGSIPPNQVAHTVTFSPPERKGTYRLMLDDNAASYNVSWAAGESISLSADPGFPFSNRSRAGRLYFYVPKGTQQILFAASSCSDCNFFNGSGTLVYSYPGGTSGSVTVPAGQDGKIWSFTGANTKNFHFLNIPGVVAVNADELLVPRWTQMQ